LRGAGHVEILRRCIARSRAMHGAPQDDELAESGGKEKGRLAKSRPAKDLKPAT